MANNAAFESFSAVASDWIRLRLALYGPEDAQALMRRCFRRSRAGRKVNERTVLACWKEQDDALDAALVEVGRPSTTDMRTKAGPVEEA